MLARVEARLAAVKLSATSASNMAGKPDAIRNLRRAVKTRSRQGITTSTLAALAPVLRTTEAWLTAGTPPEDPSAAEEMTIPVWGRAGAGGLVHNFHDSMPIDRITLPVGSKETTCALEIVGNSLGPLFNDWYAIYDEVRDPPTPDLIGKLCVLETADGRAYIKRLKKGRGKKFTLESNYDVPIYDVAVVWAAPVLNMVPR